MPICKCNQYIDTAKLVTDYFSDGSTPEKQTQQILALTPILRGQKSTEKNAIPPHHRTASYDGTAAAQSQTQPPEVHPTGKENDLIDFGQDNSTTAAPQLNVPATTVQTVNGTQQPVDIESALKSTGTTQQGSLIDFHNDLKADLPTVQSASTTLKRHNTDTSSMDEFVDAES